MAAASMTYDSLLEDVVAYTERTNDTQLVAQLPRLVLLAENKLAAKLKTLGVQQVLNTTLSPSVATLAKPEFWRNTMSFTVQLASGRRKPLLLRSYEFCTQFWPTRTSTSEPRYYADYNYQNFLITPTPDSAYTIELVYFPRLTPLSDDAQVNWFTKHAPQALLAATVHEAHLWLKNTEKAAAWSAMRDEAIADLTKEDDVRVTDRTAVVR